MQAFLTLRTAGISRALARIAACEVSPPFSAIIPTTLSISIEAVIDGRSSFATIIVCGLRLVKSTLFTPIRISITWFLKSSISATLWFMASLSIA